MYDLIIIGAGTAGISAYQQAIKYTDNLLIINAGSWETTCARVGCMPSKLMIAAANHMHEIQHSEKFGLNVEVKINTQKVMQHLQQQRDRFTKSTLKQVNSWPEKHKISGQAHFVDAQTIHVNDKVYQAKHFILAVGSTPNIDPHWQQQLGDRYITSDQIFELAELPQSIAVIGSGVIAIELAQAMHRLGVQTTIFARSRKVGSLSSPALQSLAQNILAQELNIHFETLPHAYQRTAQGVVLDYNSQQRNVEYVLAATGRKSLLSSLKLENINPQWQDLKNLPVDKKTKQLADYPIYIVGDAHTNTPIQHEAAHEGKHAVESCFSQPVKKDLKMLTPLGIVFSSPEMASVGKNFKQLTEANIAFVTGLVNYEKQGRAIVNGKNQGAVEVYIDQHTRKILGAELFCHEAEHLAHLLAWMIDESHTLDDLINKPYYHPTIIEGLRTAFKHARRQFR